MAWINYGNTNGGAAIQEAEANDFDKTLVINTDLPGQILRLRFLEILYVAIASVATRQITLLLLRGGITLFSTRLGSECDILTTETRRIQLCPDLGASAGASGIATGGTTVYHMIPRLLMGPGDSLRIVAGGGVAGDDMTPTLHYDYV